MIKLHNVNKYFNKRRANEIHVINNTSLELPESGIVALLGPSGCGKALIRLTQERYLLMMRASPR